MQSCAYYLTGREHHSGSSIDFQENGKSELAAAFGL
jgi:hypothetical protein